MSDLTTLRFSAALPPKEVPPTDVATAAWDPSADPGLVGELLQEVFGEDALPAGWDPQGLDPAGVFVARASTGEPMGFAACHDADGTGSVDMVVVRRAHRRKGVGKALLQAALAHLVRLGLTRARADIAPADRAAMGLFRAHGFGAG